MQSSCDGHSHRYVAADGNAGKHTYANTEVYTAAYSDAHPYGYSDTGNRSAVGLSYHNASAGPAHPIARWPVDSPAERDGRQP